MVVRNDRGAALLAGLDRKVVLSPLESRGKRQGPVQGFLENTRRRRGAYRSGECQPFPPAPHGLAHAPGWDPRGLEFARARLEMKAIEAVLHLRRARPARLRHMLPSHLWALVKPYGLSPTGEEQTPS